ncbi:MAG TPA: MBOAT family protein [Kiritimatiellia bacterium]|nr:MBOAT family protein [Kiritimatiellia bacterium]
MIFNSIDFVLFLLVVFPLYLALPRRGQNAMLLVASYFFYGYWDWRFLFLLAFSTVVDYAVALGMERARSPRARTWLVGTSMVVNLGLLGFFKYFNFFIGSAEEMLAAMGLPVERLYLQIVLPVGISFYTFQTMSYTLDVYRRQMAARRDFLDFALFVSFFPQLVAGPIERAAHLLPQMERPRRVTWAGLQEGAWLFTWGLFKKAVIADNLAMLVDRVFAPGADLNVFSVLLGLYAFAFQIYGDFSGYSDMARGLCRAMGFDLMVNFNNPYFALNPSDFWRRWHISLSSWLRDYLYIPLGGNRLGPRRTYVNLLLTMLLGGLWHGAAWTFVLWGAFHGALLIGHRLLGGGDARVPAALPSRLLRRIVMFHLICVSWLFFRARSMEQIGEMLCGLARWPSAPAPELANGFVFLLLLCAPLWVVQVVQERSGDLLAPIRWSFVPRTTLYLVIGLALLALGHTGGQAFIYFQF